MEPVLQRDLPFDLTPRPLPGIAPLDPATWLLRDDAFAGQMAERERLLEHARDDVLVLDAAARPAAEELLQHVLDFAYPGAGQTVTRPDGVTVATDFADPLGTIGRIAQEDFCIMEKHGDQHVLTGAVLCFPASWTLSEKFLRPLDAIHGPVEAYTPDIARRVQRLFDGVRVDKPLWRFNRLWYAEPDLHQPRREAGHRPGHQKTRRAYFRSERQTILRLPQTQAVIFSIHTFVMTARHADAVFEKKGARHAWMPGAEVSSTDRAREGLD